MPEEPEEWNNLSYHVLVRIFSYLPRNDRIRASQACRAWNEAFSSPDLWKSFDFWFYMPNQAKAAKCVDKYGKYLRNVLIELDQGVETNRNNACLVLNKLADLQEKRLQTLKITFTGENPCFYAGNEFVSALKLLFGPPPEHCNFTGYLTDVDLSNLTVGFTGELIEILAENNPYLEKLNIQNGLLICRVHPKNTLKLVQKCRRLKDLRLYKCSVTKEVLEAFAEEDRVPLEHLSINSRSEESRLEDLGDEVWKLLATKLPKFRVTLNFENTCPQGMISQVMKPSIPLRELNFAPFSSITTEIQQASAYYHKTLETIVVQSQISENVEEFSKALIQMAMECTELKSMHVSCLVNKNTIETILSVRPKLVETNNYTLKHDSDL